MRHIAYGVCLSSPGLESKQIKNDKYVGNRRRWCVRRALSVARSYIYLFDGRFRRLKSYLLFSHFSSIGRRPPRHSQIICKKTMHVRIGARGKRRTGKQTNKCGLSKYENYSVSHFSLFFSFLLTEKCSGHVATGQRCVRWAGLQQSISCARHVEANESILLCHKKIHRLLVK